MSQYKIGRDANGVNGLVDMLNITGIDPQPTEFLEYTEISGVNLSGGNVESGFPTTKWSWNTLPQASFDALTSFCTGAWSRVYIRTRVNSGTSYSYGVFRAIMNRPKASTSPGLFRQSVEVVFTQLTTP